MFLDRATEILRSGRWEYMDVTYYVNVNVNVRFMCHIRKDLDSSDSMRPVSAEGVSRPETPHRHPHAIHWASSCATRGGPERLSSNTGGARRVEPMTFWERQSAYCTR